MATYQDHCLIVWYDHSLIECLASQHCHVTNPGPQKYTHKRIQRLASLGDHDRYVFDTFDKLVDYQLTPAYTTRCYCAASAS